MTRGWVVAGAFAVLLLVPGYSTGIFHGIPLGAAGCVLLTVIVAAAVFFRQVSLGASVARRWLTIVVVLAAAHAVLAAVAPRPGWLSAQYRSAHFEGPAEASTEFSIPDATRIDDAIRFADDRLPVYFLNQASFNEGIRREVTRAYSIRWTGFVEPTQNARRRISLAARGATSATLDGTPIASVDSAGRSVAATEVDVDFAAGPHVITVSYAKPRDTDPFIEFSGLESDRDAGMLVTPRAVAARERRVMRVARTLTRVLDGAILIAAIVLVWMLASRWRTEDALGAGASPSAPERRLACAMFALFVIQGALAGRSHIGRAESLSGGDDWMAYEARAREIAVHGPAMAFDRPLGRAEVFSYYPGYSYFLAAVHKIGGEDLFAPTFAHFVLLFGANLFVYSTARLFGRRNALLSTAILVAIEEIAFMRHYTVQLFTENLYFLTVALTVAYLVRFASDGQRRDLVVAGAGGGASALVRSGMLMYLPFALIAVAAASWRRHASIGRAAGNLGVLVAAWFAVVALATMRNYVVAGRPVLIADATLPMRSFVLYNLPDTADAKVRYLDKYDGTASSAATILARIAVEHPVEFARHALTKAGFSFGALQWMGQRVHPELLLPGMGYLVALLVVPAARALRTWPVHGFVASHLIGMVLSMPSNYGYRLILPMYLFFPMFLVAVAERAFAFERRSSVARV